MNISKSSSPVRLIAFFLVAVILISTFGFSVDGWSFKDKNDGVLANGESNNTQNTNNSENGSTDEEKAPSNDEPQVYIPEHINALTGLETSEELSKKRPIAVVMNTDSASYATSYCDMMAEFPIEDGTTRLLAFITDTRNIGKIGSIAPSRNYISNLAYYYDAIQVSYGNDDSVAYSGCNVSESLFDLTINTGYHYSEYTHYQYTNADLLNAGIKNVGISIAKNEKSAPYSFNDFGNDAIKGQMKAENIQIPFSDSSVTELVFSQELGKYTLYKGREVKKDLLNDTPLSFTNCLVLFADSVTYEGVGGSQMVMNTVGSGMGFYFTEGTVMNISWSGDTDGGLKIFDESGNLLTVNRGNTYLGFMKSSRLQSVTFK